MDLVIAKNIFESANGNSIGKKDAKVVTADTSVVEVSQEISACKRALFFCQYHKDKIRHINKEEKNNGKSMF